MGRGSGQGASAARRCMEKDPKKRLRDIGGAMAWIEQGSGTVEAQIAAASPRHSRRWLWPAVGAGALALGAVLLWAPWRSRQAAVPVRFEMGPTEKMKFVAGGAMAVSPDGHWMVFPATGEDGVARYWARSLDTVEARALPGTETANVPAAWSGEPVFLFTTNNKHCGKRISARLILSEAAG